MTWIKKQNVFHIHDLWAKRVFNVFSLCKWRFKNILMLLFFVCEKSTFNVFGRPYYRSRLWYTMSSVSLSSVTFCIVAKRYVLAKNCLEELIGNQGQKVDFGGRCHISTSGFASTATKTAVFCLTFARTAQWSVLDGTNRLSSSKPCANCRIMWSELKPDVVLATIIDPERCK